MTLLYQRASKLFHFHVEMLFATYSLQLKLNVTLFPVRNSARKYCLDRGPT
jgi:hypothetical protein